MARFHRNNSERETIKRLEGEGWTVYRRGWPDLLCVRGDEIKAVEVKSLTSLGGAELSKHQTIVHDLLTRAGLTVEVTYAEEGGVQITPRVKKTQDEKRGVFVHVESSGQYVHVRSTLSGRFKIDARRAGGRWLSQKQCWSFPRERRVDVARAIAHAYGDRWIPAWLKRAASGYHLEPWGD